MKVWRDVSDQSWVRYAEALGICVLAVTLTSIIGPDISFYYLALAAVVLVSLRSGIGPAMLTTLVGALGVSWVLPPNDSFRIEGPEAWGRMILFVVVALTAAVLGSSRRRAMLGEAAARKRAERYVADLETERGIRERFVMALSHDLRTPLAAARMNLQLGLRRASDPELAATFLRKSLGNIDRTLGMIGDLLDSYRLVVGKRLPLSVEHVTLERLIAGVMTDLAPVVDVELVADVAPEIEGYWDRDFLRRMVENLCVNASKYGEPDAQVLIRARVLGEQVRISVHNSGPPIPPEVIPRLFSQLYRGKEPEGTRGWGVGLMAVRALAESHGGSVSVQSTQESGTTFNLDLPLDARPYRQAEPLDLGGKDDAHAVH